jgi:LacI family transcriptional regulator
MAEANELERIASTSPVVLADEGIERLSSVPWVTSENREGARMLGRHLRDLGHTTAVIIAGFAGLDSTVDRVAGVRESFPNALVLSGDFEMQSGYDIVADLVANGFAFTAVFACNDLMAIGAIRGLREHGLRVPEDVSVVGFDDVDVASVITPGLTTIRQDVMAIGRTSARLLIEGIEAGGTEGLESVVLPVELVVRGTTAPAAR